VPGAIPPTVAIWLAIRDRATSPLSACGSRAPTHPAVPVRKARAGVKGIRYTEYRIPSGSSGSGQDLDQALTGWGHHLVPAWINTPPRHETVSENTSVAMF